MRILLKAVAVQSVLAGVFLLCVLHAQNTTSRNPTSAVVELIWVGRISAPPGLIGPSIVRNLGWDRPSPLLDQPNQDREVVRMRLDRQDTYVGNEEAKAALGRLASRVLTNSTPGNRWRVEFVQLWEMDSFPILPQTRASLERALRRTADLLF